MYDSSEGNSMWQFMFAVTEKKDWYMKVHSDDIVNSWKDELDDTINALSDGEFELAIGILRATSKGSIHVEDCDWEYDTLVCGECLERAKQYVRDHPDEFGIGTDFPTAEALFEEDEYNDWLDDLVNTQDDVYCEHRRCGCGCPDYMLKDYVQYYAPDDYMLSADTRSELRDIIHGLMNTIPVDWHPGSNEQVRDIVHPSMYPYVKGISLFTDGNFEPYEDSPENEATRYQWLPSNMRRTDDGQSFRFESYINNLPEPENGPCMQAIEKAFNEFTPALGKVTGVDIDDFDCLQVIVKIGSTHIDSEKPVYPGGSWHIEGMPYEHIIATALHYVQVDGISDSFLEFRKPVVLNDQELDYPQSDEVYTTMHYGITPGSHYEGTMNRYLGLIKCDEGASVVFPNTLQHRVKEFHLSEDASEGLRVIIAFFLIDPKHYIESTANVPRQQTIMSLNDAHHHRERLMHHRKYFVDELNAQVYEREYSLCEH